MVLSGRVVVPRQNNEELLLRSHFNISIITVMPNRVSRNIPTTTFNHVNARQHILPACLTFPAALKGGNGWNEDVKTEMVQSVF